MAQNLARRKNQRDKDKKLTSIINPKFVTWTGHDQILPSWIRATLSEHVLSQVVGCEPLVIYGSLLNNDLHLFLVFTQLS